MSASARETLDHTNWLPTIELMTFAALTAMILLGSGPIDSSAHGVLPLNARFFELVQNEAVACRVDTWRKSTTPEEFLEGMDAYDFRQYELAFDRLSAAASKSPDDCLVVARTTSTKWNVPYLPSYFASMALCRLGRDAEGRDWARTSWLPKVAIPDKLRREYMAECDALDDRVANSER